jgi:hypothetical protein
MANELHEALRWWVLRTETFVRLVLRHMGLPANDVMLETTDAHVMAPRLPEFEVDAAVRVLGPSGLVCVMLIEVQLTRDDDKAFTWPGYLGGAAVTHRVLAVLCVLTITSAMARWAEKIHPDHDRPKTRSLVVGPELWEQWSRAHPEDPTLRLVAWLAGRCVDVSPAELLSHREQVEGLDTERARRYVWLMRAAADRLPPHLREVSMLQPYEPDCFFPIYPEEFAALKRGRREGMRKGRRKGRLEGVIEVAIDVLGQVEVDAVLANTPPGQQVERLKALVRARLKG